MTILEPVKFSEWAAPIVPVIKPDNSVRICGHYKLTVNQASKLEQYPIPKLEDLLEKLAGGEKYSKLDLSHACQQVILDEESKRYVTLGVASSPAIFQRIMEGLLQGIPGIAIYLDDILIIGRDYQEHLHTMGLIYETNVRPKIGRTVVSTQNLEFINMDVSGGYDQISRQV